LSGSIEPTFFRPSVESMMDQKHEIDVVFAAIVKRIGALFARGYGSAGGPEWLEIEMLLTDGYALVHELESERNRRRLAGAAYSIIERDIRWLRSILSEVYLQGRLLKEPAETLS
jgi:hypothetical protein